MYVDFGFWFRVVSRDDTSAGARGHSDTDITGIADDFLT